MPTQTCICVFMEDPDLLELLQCVNETDRALTVKELCRRHRLFGCQCYTPIDFNANPYRYMKDGPMKRRFLKWHRVRHTRKWIYNDKTTGRRHVLTRFQLQLKLSKTYYQKCMELYERTLRLSEHRPLLPLTPIPSSSSSSSSSSSTSTVARCLPPAFEDAQGAVDEV